MNKDLKVFCLCDEEYYVATDVLAAADIVFEQHGMRPGTDYDWQNDLVEVKNLDKVVAFVDDDGVRQSNTLREFATLYGEGYLFGYNF